MGECRKYGNNIENTQYKCAICKWYINNYCNDILEHNCFSNFNENVHEFVVDDDLYIHMVEKSQEDTKEEEVVNEDAAQDAIEPQSQDILGKLKWTHEALLCLIELYKKHLNEFMSTTERNDKVWSRVSLELISNGFNYTTNQCKFKFKYLKSKYMQKKDNMKSTSSGQACVKFRYFNELDDIFGKKAIVQPVNLASNLIKRNLTANTESVENNLCDTNGNEINYKESENELPLKKLRKTAKLNMEKLITEIQQASTSRENIRKQHHKDNMEFKREMLDAFNKKMDAIISALNKQ